jgi:hypothetical protein
MESRDIWPRVLKRMRSYLGVSWDIDGFSQTIGVTSSTVGDWISQTQPPNGERLIRLWHYLDLIGYKSPEIKELPPFNRYVGQLLALSVITMDEVIAIVGVRNSQTALHILRGTTPRHPTKSLQELEAEYDGVLKSKLAEQAMGNLRTKSYSQPAPIRNKQPENFCNINSGDTALIASTLLSAALPTARLLNSDEYTPEERSRFRGLIGPETIFELSNIVNMLTGERARNEAR